MNAKQATPREQLIQELLDSRIPKTEREHCAAREIEFLRARVAELEAGAEAEREACAVLCETSDRHRGPYFADKIRARGEK